jgi:uncharacterized membrane protein YfcA
LDISPAVDVSQVSWFQLAALAAGVIVSGLVAGLLAGLLGVGGGIIVVPMLYYVFTVLHIDPAVVMHMAVGTSLAVIIFTSLRAAYGHYRHEAVDFSILRSWSGWILIGVIAGAAIAGLVDGTVLMAVFAFIALVFSMNMAFGRESWVVSRRLPGPRLRAFISFSIGLISTLMGIGAGTLGVTAMTLFNVPIRRAVATASALGLVIAIPGAAGFIVTGLEMPGRPPYSLGYVNLVGLFFIVPATLIAAPWGVKLAHSVESRSLRLAFAVFLSVTALKMIFDLLDR